LIGPLANPAKPSHQLVGVADERQARLMADAIARQGLARAAVVTGADGLDEVTLGGTTHVRWIEAGSIRELSWQPNDFGLPKVSAAELRVTGPAESAAILQRLLAGEPSPARNAVLANVAAALLVAGRTRTLREGVEQGASAIDSGAARNTLARWRVLSQSTPQST
jgi:anthranilate phosphoribosyltransferase